MKWNVSCSAEEAAAIREQPKKPLAHADKRCNAAGGDKENAAAARIEFIISKIKTNEISQFHLKTPEVSNQ